MINRKKGRASKLLLTLIVSSIFTSNITPAFASTSDSEATIKSGTEVSSEESSEEIVLDSETEAESAEDGTSSESSEKTSEESTENTTEEMTEEVSEASTEDASEEETSEESSEETSEKTSNEESASTESEEESSREAEEEKISENAVSDNESDMTTASTDDAEDAVFSTMETQSGNSKTVNTVSFDACYGMEIKPSLLKDGTHGLIKGQKWYVGEGADTSDKKLLSISKKGLAKAKKAGTLEVGVDGKKYSMTIVEAKMSEKSIKLGVGGAQSVSLNSADGKDLGSLGYAISWISANPDVAEVVNGKIYATGLGSTKVYAYVGGKAFKVSVKVSDTKESTYVMDIVTKKTGKIKVPKANTITWSFEGSVIDIPDKKPKCTAKEQGNTDVTGNDGHKLLVYSNQPDIDTSYGIDAIGKKNQYTVKMMAGDKLYINLEKSHELPIWKSKKPEVAIANEYGVIIAERKGTTVLSAKVGGKKIKINVVVGDERSYDYNTMTSKFYKKIIIDGVNSHTTIYAFIRLNGDTVISDKNPDDYVQVNFDANGGAPSKTEEVAKGIVLDSVYEPEKSGSEFGGWLYNGYLFDFDNAIFKDTNLVADWTDDNTERFLLVLDANGGTIPGTADGTVLGVRYVTEGVVDLTDSTPSRKGYTFAGWHYQDGTAYKESDILTNDTMLVAYWTDNSTGKTIGKSDTYVLFNDGHGYIYIEDVKENKTVDAPTVTWEGHIFNGWEYADGTEYKTTDTFARTTILTATWDYSNTNESIQVKFKPNNGEDVFTAIVNYGDAVSEPETPVNGNLGFEGWYIGNTKYDFETPVTRSLTLTAHWSTSYSVSYNTLVDGCDIATEYVIPGNKAVKPDFYETYGYNPDYTFSHWNDDSTGSEYNFSISVNSDLSLTADWEEADAYFVSGEKFNKIATEVCGGKSNIDDIQKIEFYSDGIPSKSVMTDSNKVSESTGNTPIYIWKDGGTLYWWSEDLKPYLNADCSAMFEGFTHLKDLDGLKDVRLTNVNNYNNMFNNTSVTSDSFYKIGWENLIQGEVDGMYNIIYNLNGGEVSESNPVTYNPNMEFTLSNPTRDGYDFVGWTEASAGSSVSPNTVYTVSKNTTGTLTFNANWKAHVYTIEYKNVDSKYGSLNSKIIRYTIDQTPISIPDCVGNDSWDFAGWTGSNISSQTKSYVIPKGSTGDKTFVANWKLKNADSDYYQLKINFTDNNTAGKNAGKDYISYMITTKNEDGELMKKTGYVANGSVLTVLKNTDVTLTAPQFRNYQYNHYFDNWTGSGNAFSEESGQSNLSEFTGSAFTFSMAGDAEISLETVPMPAFFG